MGTKLELIGKASVHPVFFYTGKISGYSIWVLFILAISEIVHLPDHDIVGIRYVSFFFCLSGFLFTILSLINLGKSTRLGLPTAETSLKTKGIYRISRNPMYVGFALFTLASMLYTLSGYVVLLGLYSLITYHFIILSEERFLTQRFGRPYIEYQKKVRRYL